jgi:hypothetical protein
MKFMAKKDGEIVDVVGPIAKARSYAATGPFRFIEPGEAYAGRVAIAHRGESIITLSTGHRFAGNANYLAAHYEAVVEEPVKAPAAKAKAPTPAPVVKAPEAKPEPKKGKK